MTGGRQLVVIGRVPAKGGAPKGSGSRYTQEIADEIIERHASGETITRIVKFDINGEERVPRSFPSYACVYDWADPSEARAPEEFAIRFARAKEHFCRNRIERNFDIAETPMPGIEEVREFSAKNGVSLKRATKDMLHHRMLMIDTNFKAVAKIDPAKWSDRLQQLVPQETGGEDNVKRFIIIGGLPDDDPPPPPPDEDEPSSEEPPAPTPDV